MKKALFVLAGVILLGTSACKKGGVDRMMIVRDCTGTYLRMDGKDYQVCNEEKLMGFPNGAMVTAGFRHTETCAAEADRIRCYMLHPKQEGWIEVSSVH